MFTIKAILPKNRYNAGVLRLFQGERQLYAFTATCLGKADNQAAAAHGNPDRDPAKPWGDTPTGEYAPTRYFALNPPHPHMGKGWFPMTGVAGQAEDAVRGGRTGLGIHAGRGDERLVPTYGCLRLKDSDFEQLAALIGDDEVRIEIVEEDG